MVPGFTDLAVSLVILFGLCALLAVAVGLLWVAYAALVSRVERLEESRLRHRAEIDALKAETSVRRQLDSQRARESGLMQ